MRKTLGDIPNCAMSEYGLGLSWLLDDRNEAKDVNPHAVAPQHGSYSITEALLHNGLSPTGQLSPSREV